MSNTIDFVMALSGEIKLSLPHRTTYLSNRDVLMIDSDEYPAATASGTNILLVISLKKEFFYSASGFLSAQILCDSTSDTERDYSEIRRILSQVALAYFADSELEDIHQTELCYSLLHYLVKYHRVSRQAEQKSTGSRRLNLIMNYLEQNYMNAVTLTDLAGLTHLNASYLSRFVKKSTGKTFNQCLQEIRLRHAAADLSDSDRSVTDITYQNGFSSPAAFCKTFVKQYGCSPSVYRKNRATASPLRHFEKNAAEVAPSMVKEDLRLLASKGAASTRNAVRYPAQTVYTVEDVSKSTPIKPNWNQIINLGFINGIFDNHVQAQLEMAQREIGFCFCRMDGIMALEFIPDLGEGKYNFSKFDRAVSIMLAAGIKPLLNLTARIKNIFMVGRGAVLDTKDIVTTISAYTDKALAIIRHCINNYGIEEVETWAVELGMLHNEFLSPLETPKIFIKRVKPVYHEIKKLLPGIKICVLNYNAGMKEGLFEKYIAEMAAAHFFPAHIALSIFPYESAEVLNTNLRTVVTDPDHILHSILYFKGILEKYPGMTSSVWVSVLGLSMQIGDYVSDSCFQGTYYVKNTLDLIGQVDAIGYYTLSDISDEHIDTAGILFGGPGILSRNGLKKTGFSALKRLGYLNHRLMKKMNGFLAMTNGINEYDIVLYNYSHFNEAYCISGAKDVTIDNVYSMFSRQETKDLTVSLNNLPDGRYKIIITSINREHGSLFDEWTGYGILDDLQPKDIAYLRDIVHPHRAAQYTTVSGGSLHLHTQLLPHELKFYKIYREL